MSRFLRSLLFRYMHPSLPRRLSVSEAWMRIERQTQSNSISSAANKSCPREKLPKPGWSCGSKPGKAEGSSIVFVASGDVSPARLWKLESMFAKTWCTLRASSQELLAESHSAHDLSSACNKLLLSWGPSTPGALRRCSRSRKIIIAASVKTCRVWANWYQDGAKIYCCESSASAEEMHRSRDSLYWGLILPRTRNFRCKIQTPWWYIVSSWKLVMLILSLRFVLVLSNLIWGGISWYAFCIDLSISSTVS